MNVWLDKHKLEFLKNKTTDPLFSKCPPRLWIKTMQVFILLLWPVMGCKDRVVVYRTSRCNCIGVMTDEFSTSEEEVLKLWDLVFRGKEVIKRVFAGDSVSVCVWRFLVRVFDIIRRRDTWRRGRVSNRKILFERLLGLVGSHCERENKDLDVRADQTEPWRLLRVRRYWVFIGS